MRIEDSSEYHGLVRRLTQATGRDETAFSPADDLNEIGIELWEWVEIFTAVCNDHGVDPDDIHHGFPVYFEPPPTLMWSLQFLGAFSGAARRMVARLSYRVHMDTLGSVAESTRSGKYVKSGQLYPPAYEAFSRIRSLIWLAVYLVPLGVALWAAFGPCRTFGPNCPRDPDYQLGALAVGGGLTLVLLAASILPGVRELRRQANRPEGPGGRG